MMRKLIAILLAGGGSTAAAVAGFEQIFGDGSFNLDALMQEPERAGAIGGSTVVLPILFYFLSGVRSYVTSVAIVAVLMFCGLYFGLEVDAPLEQIATVSGIGAAVSVLVYRIIT